MTLLDGIATENEAALVTITHDLAVAARASRHYQLDTGVLSPAVGAPASAPSVSDEVHA